MTDQLAKSMRNRFAGQAAVEKTLTAQGSVRKRGVLAKLFGRDPLTDATRPWFAGARGEIEVGRILESLPDTWTVFHSMPIGNRETDIDHVVVGPAGVFTVTTKNHRAKDVRVTDRMIRVDGKKQVGYVPAAERESARLTDLVKRRMPDLPPVHSILAIAGVSKVKVVEAPERVVVLASHQLPEWFEGQPEVFAPHQRNAVAALLDDPAVWPPRVPSTEKDAEARFETLEREVRSARRVRIGTRLTGAVVVVGAGVAFVPSLVAALFP